LPTPTAIASSAASRAPIRTTRRTGVDTNSLPGDKGGHKVAAASDDKHFGSGGPFIAANTAPPAHDGFNPIALFNDHADRLDNLNRALHNVPLGEPLSDYDITSPFGARNDPITALSGIHEGVDLGASSGTPVMATGDGQVVWAGWRDRYGNMVEIDHGMGLHTRYAHLSKILVRMGQLVNRSGIIGLVGETGRTTGPHLHYEVRVNDEATNPMKFITAGQHVLKVE
jgi:murein DD-endopeptidase MepM/ murein hydrolase activator NlpD